MNEAREIQASRNAEEQTRHLGRLVWLSADQPVWSDGVKVSPFDKVDLLRQSKLWLEENAAAPETSQGEQSHD